MDFEFDKEMDSLLRQAARGETVSENRKSKIENPKSHLDADQIAAFAENSLPEKANALYTAHFAGCGRCRQILANVILLNAENLSETVQAPTPTKVVAAHLPWYKRLFAVPNPAYALGALVLVFAGLIAYTVFRSANTPQNYEISQIEPTEKMSGPNAGDPAQITESNQAASSASSNGNTTTPDSVRSSAAAAQTANSSLANSAAINSQTGSGSMSNSAAVSNSTTVSNKQIDTENNRTASRQNESDSSTAARTRGGESIINNADLARQTKSKAGESKSQTVEEDDDRVMMEMPLAGAPPPPMVGSSAPVAKNSSKARSASGLNEQDRKNAKSGASEARQIGGKTFKRENGAWYDQSYNGQATTNVTRGSEDFKKLDADLRSIAGSLSGAIVVVYNGKAYRIQ